MLIFLFSINFLIYRTVQYHQLSTTMEPSSSPPPLPDEWDRCHAFVARKKRYCRQIPSKGLNYCGNHLDLISTILLCQPTQTTTTKNNTDDGECSTSSTTSQRPQKRQKMTMGKRIPCPLDGNHTIYECNLKAHLKKCNKAKDKNNDRAKVYYQHDINKGGFGSVKHNTLNNLSNEIQLDEKYYQNLAIGILKAYVHVFATDDETYKRKDVIDMSMKELYQCIPSENYYSSENKLGLEEDLANHRIKIGGPKHLEQIGSIVGHVREMISCSSDNVNESNDKVKIVLEMGAGRATTGFVVASVIASCNDNVQACSNKSGNKSNFENNVKLILVERSGTRGKADRAFRREERYRKEEEEEEGDNQNLHGINQNTQNESSQSYMNVNKVNVERIKCDLSHVHIPTVLSMNGNDKTTCRDIFVIAKHCCGVGTDLALKSLLPIRDRIYGCIFTTCCHGVCSWGDYVGRDYLHEKMTEANNDISEGFKFDEEEFDLMKRWACGTVIKVPETNNVNSEPNTAHNSEMIEKDKSEHNDQTINRDEDMKNITFIVKSLKLQCGLEGLGRACQRLIDYGRHRYIQEHLFPSEHDTQQNGLYYYVDSNVTPQNLLLKGQHL